jgi:tungstate transport system permease protein
MLGLTISALSGIDGSVVETAMSLGASKTQASILALKEARFAVLTAVIMCFGRAISEVGLSIMVGGNIKGFTRTLTTAISLESSKGDIELSLALGVILLTLALMVNLLIGWLQRR